MTHNDDSARRAAKHKSDMRDYSRTMADGIVIAESRHVELDDTATDVKHTRDLIAVASYLATRFYPPLDAELAEPVLRALDMARRGEGEDDVELAGTIRTLPRAARAVGRDYRVSALELIRVTRLEHMIDLTDEIDPDMDAAHDDAAEYVATLDAPAPAAPSWSAVLRKGTGDDDVSPQSIRAARSAASSRGPGESLTGSILSMLDALDRGATVTIYAQEG